MKQIIILLALILLYSGDIFPQQVVGSGKVSISKKETVKPPVQESEKEEIKAPEIELIRPGVKKDQIITWNEKKIALIGKLTDNNQRTILYLNGKTIPVSKTGSFTIDHSLIRGINEITLKAVSENNLMSEINFKVNYQPRAPEITLLTPPVQPDQMMNSAEEKISLTGNLSSPNNGIKLYLNDKEIDVSETGFFITEHSLAQGINQISLKAVLEADVISEMKFKVNYQPRAPEITLINPVVKQDQLLEWAEEKISLTGTLNSYNQKTNLYLNDKEITVTNTGFFMTDYILGDGLNNITLKAVSESNLTDEIKFRINFQSRIIADLPDVKGKYYALLIGINNYSDPLINELDNPIRDADLFYNTLTSRYTFDKENVKLLKNATMAQMIEALDHFASIIRPVDNFLIFYAGHGVWDPSAEIGFWLPSDASRNSKLAWFRNSTLRDYLREIQSKHTLLISDACFGGSIFKTRSAFSEAPSAIKKLYELPSRKAMTSGTLTEVPDQSAFLKFLIDRLKSNKQLSLSSEQLFSSFRMAVINNSNVIPQFGEIRDVGDEGGDFIFILRK